MEERDSDKTTQADRERAEKGSAVAGETCDTGPEGDESMTPAGMNSAPAEGARTDDGEGIGCPAELRTDNE